MNVENKRLLFTKAERLAMQRRYENSKLVTEVLLSPWHQDQRPQSSLTVAWGKARAFFSRLVTKQADLEQLNIF